jgi:hypothetical protein
MELQHNNKRNIRRMHQAIRPCRREELRWTGVQGGKRWNHTRVPLGIGARGSSHII